MKYAFLLIILIIIGFIWYSRQSINPSGSDPDGLNYAAQAAIYQQIKPMHFPEILEPPISEFNSRITKKPFGIYITPETSPVHPDRWTGYHTGVDIEYEDVLYDVPVRAIADGEILLNKFATGYGGVVVIRHNIYGQDILALYGHLDPESLPLKNIKEVKQGQIIGILGEGGTYETDGARKHLHFALIKKDMGSTHSIPSGSPRGTRGATGSPQALDIRGYVKSQEELAGWYDPEEFYR